MTAFRPEPHTLLTEVAPTRSASPAPSGNDPRRIGAKPRSNHVSEDDFIDLRLTYLRPFQGGSGNDAAQLCGRDLGKHS